MPFPQTNLPLLTEVLINGAWTDVSARRRIVNPEAGLTITRGRGDWASRAIASRCTQAFENADGFFSNRLATSPNYQLLGRNTQLRHRVRWVRATFGGSASGGWAVADTGQAWVSSGGTIGTDYAEAGGFGTHTLTTVSTARNSIMTTPAAPLDVQATVKVSQVATGDNIYAGPSLSDGTSNNLYQARLQLRPDLTVWLEVIKRVAGVQSTVIPAVQVGTYTADFRWVVRLRRTAGGVLRAAAWRRFPTLTQNTWNVSAVDMDLTSFSAIICRSQTGSANTNTNPVVSWDEVEVNDYRFWGETSAFAPQWDLSGKDVTAPITAAGIMQRLSGRGGRSLGSPAYEATVAAAPDFWWPLEDGSDSIAGAPAAGSSATLVATALPLSSYTPVTAAADAVRFGAAGPVGAAAAAQLGDGWAIIGPVSDPHNLQFTAASWFEMPGDAGANSYLSINVNCSASTTSSAEVRFAQLDIKPTTVTFNVVYGDGSSAGLAPVSMPSVAAGWHHVALTGLQTGPDVLYKVWVDGQLVTTTTDTASTLVSPQRIALSNIRLAAPATGAEYHWGASHLTYWRTALGAGSMSILASAGIGWAGETAGARLSRLCASNAVPLDLIGDPAGTTPMGAQHAGKLLDLLFDCADADQGILFEPRDAFGLAYRTRTSLYNQTGPLLDYAAGYVMQPFQPTEDDQLTENDVTVTRVGGSSARATVTAGPLSTQDPPAGVGAYGAPFSANLATDALCAPLASWLVYLGTWDEARFANLGVNFAAPSLAANLPLSAALASVDIGDVVTVTDLPAWVPPDPVALLVQGTTEYIGDGKEWSTSWNTTPAAPFTFGIVEDATLGRADASGLSTTSAAFVSGVSTSLSVATSAGPLWATGAAGFDIRAAGVTLHVITISGAASPQTFLVDVTPVNGVQKSIPTGSAVYLAHPMRAAL